MRRKIAAFVAFNVYSIALLDAFERNTVFLFHPEIASDLGVPDAYTWGWGEHYIWRLLAACVVTFLVGFLAGAIAKSHGREVAAISNIPSVLWHAAGFCLIAFGGVQFEGSTGFAVISVAAMPLTTCIAYLSGALGEQVQNEECVENTVLGIWPYHWVWAVFPVFWYTCGAVYAVATFFRIQWTTGLDLIALPANLLALVPVAAWVGPLVLAHQVLAGEVMPESSKSLRALAVTGIVLFGLVVAVAVQLGCYWLLGKLLWVSIALIAIGVFGYLLAEAIRKKKEATAEQGSGEGRGYADME